MPTLNLGPYKPVANTTSDANAISNAFTATETVVNDLTDANFADNADLDTSKILWPVGASSTDLKAFFPSSVPTDGAPVWLRPAASDERLLVVWDSTLDKWVSQVQLACQISSTNGSGVDTATSATYANLSNNHIFFNAILPWAVYNTAGFTWQFRWKSSITWGASQASWGMRLTAYGAAVGGAFTQDTTNIFGEVTAFTANSTKLVDSGWMDIDVDLTETDYLIVWPQWKSDGTRTIATSFPGLFTCQARLVAA